MRTQTQNQSLGDSGICWRALKIKVGSQKQESLLFGKVTDLNLEMVFAERHQCTPTFPGVFVTGKIIVSSGRSVFPPPDVSVMLCIRTLHRLCLATQCLSPRFLRFDLFKESIRRKNGFVFQKLTYQ